jgi:hypothetical protein
MITQAYILNTTNQLIDINDAYSSFTTLMNVTCENLQDSFDYAIINQSTLDTNQIKFKKATGFWEDSFTINQENFQNWYLVLKADKETKCNVNLNITPLNYDTNPTQKPNTENMPQIRSNTTKTQYPPDSEFMRPNEVVKQSPQRRRQPSPPQQLQRRQQLKPQPIQLKSANVKPKKQYEEEYEDEYYEDEDEEDEKIENTSNYKKYYKYIGYSLIGIIILLIILWWTGYIHKVPFINKFFKNTAAVVDNSVATAVTHKIHHPPSLQNITHRVSTPIQSPSPATVDTNFINEMRELKIDL